MGQPWFYLRLVAHSEKGVAVRFSPGCESPPVCAGAAPTAADRAAPDPESTTAETALPPPVSEYGLHPACPSSVCARNWPGSALHPRSRSRVPSPSPVSPVSVSSHAICCQLGWKSHPIIIIAKTPFFPASLSSTQDYRVESSLRSYPIKPNVVRFDVRVGSTPAERLVFPNLARGGGSRGSANHAGFISCQQ